jgi:hypothetical protein
MYPLTLFLLVGRNLTEALALPLGAIVVLSNVRVKCASLGVTEAIVTGIPPALVRVIFRVEVVPIPTSPKATVFEEKVSCGGPTGKLPSARIREA